MNKQEDFQPETEQTKQSETERLREEAGKGEDDEQSTVGYFQVFTKIYI